MAKEIIYTCDSCGVKDFKESKMKYLTIIMTPTPIDEQKWQNFALAKVDEAIWCDKCITSRDMEKVSARLQKAVKDGVEAKKTFGERFDDLINDAVQDSIENQ